MKALTICQPYASLIIRGDKRVENRTWAPPASLIGQRIAIHAGKSPRMIWDDGHGGDIDYGLSADKMPRGAILGTARFAGWVAGARYRDGFVINVFQTCPELRSLPWIGSHLHAEGPFCWVLEDVQPCDPIPCSGKQGLWDVPEELCDVLKRWGVRVEP